MATVLLLLGSTFLDDVRADGIGYENLPAQELCGLCHGLNGISPMPRFPKLAGQDAAYIEKQLRDFRARLRTNEGGQMEVIANEIREEQIGEVARYFADQPAPEPHEREGPMPGDARAMELYTAGDAKLGIPACASCHGKISGDAQGQSVLAPHLTAQHESYLAKQLADFRSGARTNDIDATMQGIARRLGDDEIAALASYLAAAPRE